MKDLALGGRLARAIQSRDAFDFALRALNATETPDPEDRACLEQVEQACRSISKKMLDLQSQVLHLLDEAGIQASGSDSDLLARGAQQFHHCRIRIPVEHIAAAVEALNSIGFSMRVALDRVAVALLTRYQKQITLIRFDEDTTRITLRWSEQLPSCLHAALRPSLTDAAYLKLPPRLVALYPFVRLLRRIRKSGSVGTKGFEDQDYLRTPQSLVSPLLVAAGVTAEDTVCDLGCGYGQVVIHAAEAFGCRAVGVEAAPEMVAAARQSVDRAGLQHRVEIRHQVIEEADLSGVDVVFLFLPSAVVNRLLPLLLKRMRKGARLVVHEQAPMMLEPPPDQSLPLVSATALTVAHLWRV